MIGKVAEDDGTVSVVTHDQQERWGPLQGGPALSAGEIASACPYRNCRHRFFKPALLAGEISGQVAFSTGGAVVLQGGPAETAGETIDAEWGAGGRRRSFNDDRLKKPVRRTL